MKTKLYVIAMSILFMACEKEEKQNDMVENISAAELKLKIDEAVGIKIIDVSPYYDEGHIPTSVNYKVGEDLSNAIPSLDKSMTYVVYCHADDPSIRGANQLINAGFEKVSRLTGNYQAWSDLYYVDIAAGKAKEKIDMKSVIVIDVSSAYKDGHLPGALSYPISGNYLQGKLNQFNNNSSYLVYCHSDGPSMQGADLISNSGVKNVFRLEGNFGGWISAGNQTEISAYIDITAAEAKPMVDSGNFFIIDVSPYYDNGHLPGAVNYKWQSDFELQIPLMDKNIKYLIYCHGDAPSIAAANSLIMNNFSMVFRLKGNYSSWKDAGYPVE